MFKPPAPAPATATGPRFNPSVGILGVQANMLLAEIEAEAEVSIPRSGFWVFKRVQWRCGMWPAVVSIPRSGFWVFKHANAAVHDAVGWVSIPRSGFWVFKQQRRARREKSHRSFNPSVGILGVQAVLMCRGSQSEGAFQSLGRDSGCSSLMSILAVGVAPRPFQSLGRDSGCSSIDADRTENDGFAVSIPRSGFWVFKPPLI